MHQTNSLLIRGEKATNISDLKTPKKIYILIGALIESMT
jgi:hypothetical protein